MAQITLTIPQENVADVAAAYRVTTVAEFKDKLIFEIKHNVELYKKEQQRLAQQPIVLPDIT